MDKHHLLLIVHLLSATIWVGGHLVLMCGFLPKALKEKNFDYIGNFEKTYEPIGMPALLLLVITGIMMAYDYDATFTKWFFIFECYRKSCFHKINFTSYHSLFCNFGTNSGLTKIKKG